MPFFLLIVLLLSAPAFSDVQPNHSAQIDVEKRELPPIRNSIFKPISKAMDEIEKNKFDKAEKRLRKLLKKNDLNGYELANVYNTLAFVLYKRGDYDATLELYELVIAQSPHIPIPLEHATYYTAGAVALRAKNYERSKQLFEHYLTVVPQPNPRADRLLLEVYAELNLFAEGEVLLTRYLEHLSQNGEQPNERLLEIMAEYEAR